MNFRGDLRQSSPVADIFAKKRDQRRTDAFTLRDEIPEKETEYSGEKNVQQRRLNDSADGSLRGYEIPSFGSPKYIIKEDIDPRIAFVQERAPLVEIPVIGEFNEDMADNFETLMQVAISNNHNMVVVRIHSPGGSVYALNRMLSTMEIAKQSGMIVATMCTGIAMSCGSILLAMGTLGHRYCSRHSRVLIHQISGGLKGTKNSMENELSEYDFDNADLFRKIARNARLADEDYYLKLVDKLNQDVWIHPASAFSLRLVDHIDLPVISKRVTLGYTIELPCKEPSYEEIGRMLARETSKKGTSFGPAPEAIPKDQPAPYYECAREEKKPNNDTKGSGLVEVVGKPAQEKMTVRAKLPGSLLAENYY